MHVYRRSSKKGADVLCGPRNVAKDGSCRGTTPRLPLFPRSLNMARTLTTAEHSDASAWVKQHELKCICGDESLSSSDKTLAVDGAEFIQVNCVKCLARFLYPASVAQVAAPKRR
jgi:hypothetical protein